MIVIGEQLSNDRFPFCPQTLKPKADHHILCLGKPMSLGLTKIARSVIESEKEGVHVEDSDILVYQARSSGIGDLSSAEFINGGDRLTHGIDPSDCAQVPFTECIPFTWFTEVFDDLAPDLERQLRDSHSYTIVF